MTACTFITKTKTAAVETCNNENLKLELRMIKMRGGGAGGKSPDNAKSSPTKKKNTFGSVGSTNGANSI